MGWNILSYYDIILLWISVTNLNQRGKTMAVESNLGKESLTLLFNYGTMNGKVVRKNKSYAYLNKEATDAQIMAASQAIDALMVPTMENTYKVMTYELVDVG